VIRYFDSNVTLGKMKTPAPGGILDAAKLLAEMDRYGLSEALVCHALARRHDPVSGNALAAEAAAPSERLHACWYVLPTGTDEMPPLDTLAAQMQEADVRAVRIAPANDAHMFSLAEVVCGDLFAWIERARLPLFIEQPSVAWADLDAMMERHPEIRLVLTDVSYRINRDLYPRLKAYSHLYVETSGFQQQCGIEDVCGRFGAGRLVFGSRLPTLCAGAAMHAVEHAAIDEDAKAAVGGDNLRSMIAEVRL